jgi:hypothetical protein
MILIKIPLHAILSVNVLNINTVRLGTYAPVSMEVLCQIAHRVAKRSVET